MKKNFQQLNQKSFYLHSYKNRRSYPISTYSLTHLLDRINIDRHRSNQSFYFEHFIYTFILLLVCIFIGTIFFQLHIKVYNTIVGPFHFNQEQFIEYVNQYKYAKNQSYLSKVWKIEYIQVELNENNIQNSVDKYDIIRKFSDPRTRRNHIATYKRITRPAMYVKLPTHSQKYFHTRYPIRFKSYSIKTLQCIVRNLPFHSSITYQSWIEKSEYVQFIHQEYAKNSTQFNKLVLTKCGILIGYLYRPTDEKAFTLTHDHIFTKFDVALNMTEDYYSFYTYIICGLIFSWLLIKTSYYLIRHLSNHIRLCFLHRYGIFSYSLEFFPDVLEELWLLNLAGYPHDQLLKLDELIQKSPYKYTKNLIIIENNYQQLFVVILKVNLNVNDKLSPFIICPVTDIRKITQYGGICYGKDSSWIGWPVVTTHEQNYAEWLHEQLMEISPIYKKRYEERLRNEHENELPSYFTGRSSGNCTAQRKRGRQQQSRVIIATTHGENSPLSYLIREERNRQRLQIERQNLIENLENLRQPISPATAQFIAKFRFENECHKKLVNIDMVKKQIQCTLCQEDLQLNDNYAVWPCPGAHAFHYDCMLKSLRVRNTCPNCRHQVEGVSATSTQLVLTQFLSRLFT